MSHFSLTINELILWYSTPFSTLRVFQLHHGGQLHLSMLSWSSFSSTPDNILAYPLPAFPPRHRQNKRQRDRRMNPVGMTIMDPRKNYWPSHGRNQRPPILKSRPLPTKLRQKGYFSLKHVT